MILTRLALENVGVFKGKCELDLRPGRNPRKPVVLVGGMNGTGKTTILDSVRLCLYGPSSFGLPSRRQKDFLMEKIHSHPSLLVQLDRASIELEFELSHLGELHTYKVSRSWGNSQESQPDEMHVWRDGKEVSSFGSEQWDAFVRELIPPEISRLYFFDAEKIKEIADEALETQVLQSSIKELLGLQLVDRLQADLDILSSRYMKGQNGAEQFRQIEMWKRELIRLNEQLDVCRQNVAGLESRLGNIRAELDRRNQEFLKLGGGYALSRQDHQARRDLVAVRLSEIEDQLKSECADLLPVALAPNLGSATLSQLDADARSKAKRLSAGWARPSRNEIELILRSLALWQGLGIDDDLRDNLVDGIVDAVVGNQQDNEDAVVVHDVGFGTEALIRRSLAEAALVSSRVRALVLEHDALTRELESLETMIRLAPTEDAVKPAYDIVMELQKEVGSLEQGLRTELEKQAAVRTERDRVARQIDAEKRRVAELDGLDTKLGRIGQVATALKGYSDELCRARALELQEHISECHALLARKSDLVHSIDVDPVTFEVTLRDRQGREKTREMLSTGEKQVYAITLLWALARCAHRDFPFIIDTPLARLDSGHRDRFVTNFAAAASPQIVLLSTDTEVEKDLYAKMTHLVSKSYHLDYDSAEGCSSIRRGYFWMRSSEAVK